MVIDIISYTDTQYAALSEEQILEVQQAQLKKNRLLIKLEEDKRKEKYRLIENGVFLSKIWDLYCEKFGNRCFTYDLHPKRNPILRKRGRRTRPIPWIIL